MHGVPWVTFTLVWGSAAVKRLKNTDLDHTNTRLMMKMAYKWVITELFTSPHSPRIGQCHHSASNSQWQCDNCWHYTKLFQIKFKLLIRKSKFAHHQVPAVFVVSSAALWDQANWHHSQHHKPTSHALCLSSSRLNYIHATAGVSATAKRDHNY